MQLTRFWNKDTYLRICISELFGNMCSTLLGNFGNTQSSLLENEHKFFLKVLDYVEVYVGCTAGTDN